MHSKFSPQPSMQRIEELIDALGGEPVMCQVHDMLMARLGFRRDARCGGKARSDNVRKTTPDRNSFLLSCVNAEGNA